MKSCLLLLSIVVVQSVLAQEALLQFEQANQLYRNGDFQQAAVRYEQVVKNGYEGPALFYNLGNAYFKLKNIPVAIVNYERAKLLAPHDEDISYNLRLANLRVVDKIEPIPQLFFIEWWRAFINIFSSGAWARTAIGALWCAALNGTIFLMIKSAAFRRVIFLFGIVCLLLCVLSWVAIIQQYHHERDDQMAIILSPSVSVKSSPDAQSTDLFVLHEGVKVDILDAVGEWKKIRLADGKIGWMPADSLQVI